MRTVYRSREDQIKIDGYIYEDLFWIANVPDRTASAIHSPRMPELSRYTMDPSMRLRINAYRRASKHR